MSGITGRAQERKKNGGVRKRTIMRLLKKIITIFGAYNRRNAYVWLNESIFIYDKRMITGVNLKCRIIKKSFLLLFK